MADQLHIVAPDGTLGTIPAESRDQALQMGYRDATPDEVRDAQTRQNANTPAGMLTTFLTNAGNEFFLGAPGASVDVAAAYGNKTAQGIKRTGDLYSDENPIAAGLGKVAGFGANLFATGGLGALEKVGEFGASAAAKTGLTGAAEAVAGEAGSNLATKAASNAAQSAAISAAAAAAPAVTQAVMGDPKAAVDRFLGTVGMGALIGTAATPFIEIGHDAVEAVVRKAQGLNETAYRLAAETAGLTPTQLEKLEKFHGITVRDIGKYLLDNGIVEMGDTGKASLTKLGERMEDVGERIGGILKDVDAKTGGDSVDLYGILDRTNQKIGSWDVESIPVEQREGMKRLAESHLESGLLGEPRGDILSNTRNAVDSKAQNAAVLQDKLDLLTAQHQELSAKLASQQRANAAAMHMDQGVSRDIEKLTKQLSDVSDQIATTSEALNNTGNSAQPLIDRLQQLAKPPVVSAEALGRFKTQLSKTIETSFEKGTLPPNKRALMILRDEVSKELERIVGRQGQPQLDDYLGLKREYEMGKPLQKGFTKQAARELSPSGSLLEKIKGAPSVIAGALIGAGAGALSGGALLAMPAALLGSVASNYLRRRSTSTLAAILDRASEFEFTMPKLGALTVPKASGEAAQLISTSHFPEYSKALSNFIAQPQLVAQRLPNAGNTDLQGALTDTALRAHNFLFSKLPKNPNPNPLNPDSPWQPSDQELAKFNRYYQAINDPKTALEHLTPEGLETLQAVYPTLYSDLVEGLAQHFAGKQPNFRERMQLSKLFQMPEMNSLPFLQANFFLNATAPSAGGGNKPTASGAASLGMADQVQTPTQRIEAR